MAVCVSRFCFVTLLFFIPSLFSVILAFHFVDYSPSINSIYLQQLDDSSVENDDLSKTFYRLQKRATNSSPIKKARSSIEKKTSVKYLTTESSKSVEPHLKTLGFEEKNVTDNSTFTPNATVLDLSTVSTHFENEKYNISATSSAVVNESSSTTSTTTTTTMVPKTTPDFALPTTPSNISNITFDYHIYYNSSFYLEEEKAMSYWVNFDDLPDDKVVIHRMLSDSHRRAATVTLSFDFPFYGHPLRNITIATGGFVYMGDYMHSWLAATQYIAPLMANFDTSLSNDSTVRYFDNGTAFIIEWNQVTLQDKKRGGNFTFQTTLLRNGNIVFVYQVIPVPVKDIGDASHPVKVGLSDAYVIDRIIYFIRRKTIYEYHRIDMKKEEVGNHTAIYFTALPTCLNLGDCAECMGSDIGLECVWCESAGRCSDGLDRRRQDWLQMRCDLDKGSFNCTAPVTDNPSKSYPLYPTAFPDPILGPQAHAPDTEAATSARVAEESSSMGVGSVVAILLILAIVTGGLLWIGYAYRNPHTSSGQLLIRYRPSQWRFRSGEARYTAASVHM